jgi:hypothetical protein
LVEVDEENFASHKSGTERSILTAFLDNCGYSFLI